MEDEEARSSYYSLVSRLDQLGFIMKYLERNQNMGSRLERACVPLDLAAKEASTKGSLLDRVASLEHRLFQLCLEMESSSLRTLLTSCDQNNPSTQVCSSFPIFRYPNEGHIRHDSIVQANQLQGKSQRMDEKEKKHSNSGKAQRKMKRVEKSKKKEEANAGSWPRLRMLGC